MKTKRLDKAETAAFQTLEPRLLLDGGMWSAVGAVEGPETGGDAATTQEVHVAVEGDGVPDERDADIDNDGEAPNSNALLENSETNALSADADGDGKLGLADVKTSAQQPTSLTFNGQGSDLNESDAGTPDVRDAGEGGAVSLVLAYEPVWAIGTGKAADSDAGETESGEPCGVDLLSAEPVPTITLSDGPHADSSDDPTPVFLTPENNPLN